ncbi:ABC transporter permease [Arcticibacterium luteifluviistationis]|uniref:Ribose ABC transporter permease n=1 Tax=Arcticibacterium luteifluviistationis TaxID=1784714 RepID=A0A2Z4GGD8_9BACT|nr:ABC transporter permease [Arcticibacterium luteifluviistationis]AWW00331.1 ribose ABC transporter permease [Arcticibacterium luteifluviistationis]
MQFTKSLKEYGILISFIVTCAILSIATPQFLSVANWTIIITQVSINALLAFGVTFVIITGGIDLSIGSIVAVTGVVAASLAQNGDYPVIVAVIGGLMAGLAFGLLNGFLVTKSKIAPFIVTLGTMTIGRGLALILSKGRPVSNLSDSFNFIGNGKIAGLPVPIIILIIVFIICSIALRKTIFGRYIYAIGGNEDAAWASGISVDKIKLAAYAICGALAGLAGILLTARINTGQPNSGMGFELDAIAAVVIGGTSTTGGRGTMIGTLIGVLLIGVINNGLDLMNVTSYYQQVIMGVIIIGAVLMDSWNQKTRN